MRIKEFIFLFTKSLNPLNYKMLVTRKKRDTMKYFILLLFFAILLGGISRLPQLTNMPKDISTTLSKFERFNITGIDIEMREPITLIHNPKIVLNLNENTTIGDESVLITKTDIYWKKFKPSLFDLSLYKTESKPVKEYSDVIQNINSINGIYWLLFFILLPSLLLFVFVLNLVKYLIWVILLSLLSYLILLIIKIKAKYLQLLRAAIFSITLMVVLEIIITPLFDLGIFPLILYLFFYSLIIFLNFDKKIEIKNEER